ncbi:unnamed protein product [Caenorhabditis angaria]|uniref:RING-type E3 ubiquitin transferase n=1 Tax=Caenorhabditis angaria TaxID=860376 RepID=A0A9P1I974_9PELO|nr:unnamed protein product [Caenorhabditis angaria]
MSETQQPKKTNNNNQNQNRRGNSSRGGYSNNGNRRNAAGSGENGKVDMRKYDKMISAAHNNFSDIACGRKTEDCLICCKPNDVFAIGDCRHPVCAECAIRIRIIGQSKTCPACRKEIDTYFFCTTADDMMNVPLFFAKTNHPDEDRYGVRFSNSVAGSKYEKYLAHVCKICKSEDGERLEFPTFMSLRQHMANNHQLSYCHICTENLNLFSRERKCYTREQLQRHIRIGDNDDKSFKGHPQCLFCELKFLDEENRYKHLRKDHFFCQFCEADGTLNVFYGKHDELKQHYKQQHFICEAGECKELGIAFATKLELDLHRASEHDEKRIDLGFSRPARETNGGRIRSRNAPPEVPRDRIAVVQRQQATNPQSDPSEFTVVPSAQSRRPIRYSSTRANFTPQDQDFPSLAPAPAPPPTLRSNAFPRLNKVNKKREEEGPVEHFPTLGGAGTSTRVSVKPLPKPRKVAQQPKKVVTNNTKPNNSKIERERSYSPIREHVPQTTVKVNNTLLRFDTISNSSTAPAAPKSNIQLIQRTKPDTSSSSSNTNSARLPTSNNDFPSLPPASAPSSQPANSAWLNSKNKTKGIISSVHVPLNYSAASQNPKKNKKVKTPMNDVWSSLGPRPSEVKPLVDTDSWNEVPLSKEAQAEKEKQAKREEWARKKAEIRAAVAKNPAKKEEPQKIEEENVAIPTPVKEVQQEKEVEFQTKSSNKKNNKKEKKIEPKEEIVKSSIKESSEAFQQKVDALWSMPSVTSMFSNFSLSSMFGSGSSGSQPTTPSVPLPPPGLENVVLTPPPGLNSADVSQISFNSAPVLSYEDVKKPNKQKAAVETNKVDEDGWTTTGPVKTKNNKKKNKN